MIWGIYRIYGIVTSYVLVQSFQYLVVHVRYLIDAAQTEIVIHISLGLWMHEGNVVLVMKTLEKTSRNRRKSNNKNRRNS